MKIVESERLLFRRQVLADLDNLFELYCDPDVTRFVPDAPVRREGVRKEIMWHMNGHPVYPELGLWATIYKETNTYIGRCGLIPWDLDGQNEIEVAYLINKAYWGQGLGTEAAQTVMAYGFEELNLQRVVSLIDKENIASIKVAQNIGMVFERSGEDDLGPFQLYARNKLPDSQANALSKG